MKRLKEFKGFSNSLDLNKIKGGHLSSVAYTVIITNCGEIEDAERDED